MAWKRSVYRLQPETDPLSSALNRHVRPAGSMRYSFTMRVGETFSKDVGELCELMREQWTKAEVVRMAVERLGQELRGEPRVLIEKLRKQDGTPSS